MQCLIYKGKAKAKHTYVSVDLFLQILVDPLQCRVAALYSRQDRTCSLAYHSI